MQFEDAGGAETRPVFVDASGRRGRRVRRGFWALGLVMAAYVATVVLALVGPPGLSRLTVPGLGSVLPGPGAPRLSAGGGRHEQIARVLASPSARPQPARSSAPSPAAFASAAAAATSAAPAALTPAPVATPVPRRSPGTTGRPSPVPAASPTAPPVRSSSRPTSHPTPHSTRAAKAQASPAPTPT